jgi:YVTN family beta-propeller protein
MAHAEPFAYIPNMEDNTVSVIDLARDGVVKTLAVGERPLGVAVATDGSKAYVANFMGRSVSVIDGKTQDVLITKPLDINPMSLAVNSTQSRLYVAGTRASASQSKISNGPPLLLVLDASTLAPLGEIPLDGQGGHHVAVSPDDSQVWVSVGSYAVAVIDTARNAVSQMVNVQAGDESPLAFGANPGVAYVAGASNLIAVDVSSGAPKFQNTHMMAGRGSGGLALSPDGERAYVAREGLGLDVYDLDDQNRVSFVKTGEHPSGVAVHPDGSRIYVVNETENTVAVVDTKTLAVVNSIRVGKQPVGRGRFIQPPKPGIATASFSAGKKAWVWNLALGVIALVAVFLGLRVFRSR